MTIIIILVVIVLIIFLVFRKKNETTFSKINSDNEINSETQQFQSKLSTIPFPDRIDDIVWHINAIEKAISKNDLKFANLSYAKLIESIRQLNTNENGKHEAALKSIREEYQLFRETYGLEYPQEFLAPSERKKEETSTNTHSDTLVYLETLNFEELPKSIIKHIDIVRTVSQWNELGFNPKKEKYGRWNSIKRQDRYFEFIGGYITNPRHKISFETGKRITSKPFYIKALIDQGLSLEEFVDNGEDLEHFINAATLYDEQSYENALKEIELAISIRIHSDYKELRKDIQIKLGNDDIIEQEFRKNEYDIDSPIHTGEIFDWFKALIKNKKYNKVIMYIEKTNETLDKLSKGELKPKIYGQQSSDWYLYKKEDFCKNLSKIFDFNDFAFEKSDDIAKMLEMFISIYLGKDIKPYETIADLYTEWNQNDRAIELYKLCLTKIENEEKPRVKARLIKKIDDLNT